MEKENIQEKFKKRKKIPNPKCYSFKSFAEQSGDLF